MFSFLFRLIFMVLAVLLVREVLRGVMAVVHRRPGRNQSIPPKRPRSEPAKEKLPYREEDILDVRFSDLEKKNHEPE